MTETAQEQKPQKTLDLGGDAMLRVFIDTVNHNHMSFDITLIVGGSIVSGLLVSGRTFWEEFGNVFEAHGVQMKDAAALIVDTLYPNPDPQKEGDNGPDINSIGFLHLKNVQILAGQTISPTRGAEFPYWRLQLSSVDAWTLGRMNVK